MVDLSKLNTLKQKLIKAKDFSEVWNYFCDHFGEKPEFIALGEQAQDAFLEAVFEQIGKQLFKGHAVVSHLALRRLAEHAFIHGGCTLNGRLANVLFFEDVQVGVLAVVLSFSPSETHMIRFTGRAAPVPAEPSKN